MLRPEMQTTHSMPDFLADTASFLTPVEQDKLWRAAILMADSRGVVLRLTAMFGRRIEALRARISTTGDRLGGQAWTELTRHAQDAVEDTLWRSYSLATFGLTAVPRAIRLQHRHGNAVHRLATTASGVASGFVGLPGVLFDIPFTTTTILRSIAQVARDAGEDITAEETQRACLEVLAFGGPGAADNETETGYWATRIGVNHFTLNLLIKNAAARFGLVLSEKFLAQTVPIAGALTGGALNYAFTEYYQKMAQVHFCLRALERRTGQPEAIRQCFAEMLAAARERRRITRKSGDERTVAYLPR
jgi:EcsC protein family